jgi:metal-responsive CopG/Arc/MetJ family transcriptional regulator
MKLVPVDVPESYLKLIKKSCICTGITRSEFVRQAVKSFLIREITLAEELENEL